MENQFCYISNEPFYIRAEKILGRKFSDSNKSVIFQLCSNMRGFFILCHSFDVNGNTSRFGGASNRASTSRLLLPVVSSLNPFVFGPGLESGLETYSWFGFLVESNGFSIFKNQYAVQEFSLNPQNNIFTRPYGLAARHGSVYCIKLSRTMGVATDRV